MGDIVLDHQAGPQDPDPGHGPVPMTEGDDDHLLDDQGLLLTEAGEGKGRINENIAFCCQK